MTITFPCKQCGKKYRVTVEHAGKHFQCRQCGKVIRAPIPRDIVAENEVTGGLRALAQVRSGEQSEPGFISADNAESTFDLDTAPQTKIAPQKVRTKKSFRVQFDWFDGARVSKAVAAFLVVCLIALAPISRLSAVLLLALGFMTYVVAGIWLVVAPFRESFGCGLLNLFMPFYALYYLFSRWESMWRPFGLGLAGFAMMVFGPMLNARVREVVLGVNSPDGIASLSSEFTASPTETGTTSQNKFEREFVGMFLRLVEDAERLPSNSFPGHPMGPPINLKTDPPKTNTSRAEMEARARKFEQDMRNWREGSMRRIMFGYGPKQTVALVVHNVPERDYEVWNSLRKRVQALLSSPSPEGYAFMGYLTDHLYVLAPVSDSAAIAKKIDFGKSKRVTNRIIEVDLDVDLLAAGPAVATSDSAPPRDNRETDRPTDFVGQFRFRCASKDSKQRRQAVEDVITVEPNEHRQKIAEDLQRLMADDDSEVALSSLRALRKWGDVTCVPEVIMLWANNSWSFKEEAMRTLARFPTEAGAEAVAQNLKFRGSGEALEAMGAIAEKPLSKLLTSREFRQPDEAFKVLKKMNQKQQLLTETVDALTGLLSSSEDNFLRKDVLQFLTSFKQENVAEAIAQQLTNGWLRGDARRALQAMGPVAEKSVTAKLQHENSDVRRDATDILRVIGTKASIKDLRAATRDRSNSVASGAKEALDEISRREKAR